ncbi:DNA polymerase III subunit gamma/tau [Paludicola sp. MB14-C6]|uniref:DNA polymerase III subunit gamma/tau n=1 Tax=Paludihabitans sp. MB14-C6 TaxID=3070656 RepID=UPI0027DCB7CC|nr:DNA polymerase III subunit gamma/tau [Paludicola sp. MB14-C6]WMJ21931.1 DNA polymerase III subunit gamma/tau [Paludicola sp. MB14-C6]
MYLALYRKWRPKSFEDVISQPHITTTLKNEVQNNRLAHAYLFTGPRGTGKTTCSKILAMAVNCKHPVDGNPCMECESCKGIDDGSILDVVEIDAASNNGVDNIRQLREDANYTPSQCKYRVYIIDEVHMLSTGAFNAFLKLMEEPPSHVIFILATTETHKVPATIISRCQRFDFKRIQSEDIVERLLYITKEEKTFTLQEEAAQLIARLADGGMRDALSILDQCIAYSSEVTAEIVVDAAGIVGRDYLFEITDYILAHDAAGAVTLVDKLYSMSKDLQGLLEELIHHFRNIMLTKALGKPEKLVEVLPNEQEQLKSYAEKIPLTVVLRTISELQDCLDKMGKSIDRRLNLELYLVKLCTPSLNTTNDALVARIDKLEAMIQNGVVMQSISQQPTQKTVVAKKSKQEIASPNAVTTQPEQPSVSEPMEQSNVDGELQPFRDWAEVLEILKDKEPPIYGVLQGSMAYVGQGGLWIVSTSGFASTFMKQEGQANKLLDIVETKIGVRYRLRVKDKIKKAKEPNVNLLDDVLNNAKQLGVPVNEG